MSTQSNRVINAPAGPLLIIRPEFFAITGSAEGAAILNYFEYEYTRLVARKGWHAIGIDGLVHRFYGAFGKHRLKSALKLLLDRNYLTQRKARNPYQRAPEYCLNVEVVQAAVDAWVQQNAPDPAPVVENEGAEISTSTSRIGKSTSQNGKSMDLKQLIDSANLAYRQAESASRQAESANDSRSLSLDLFQIEEEKDKDARAALQTKFLVFIEQLENQDPLFPKPVLKSMSLGTVNGRQWTIRVLNVAQAWIGRYVRMFGNLLRTVCGEQVELAFEFYAPGGAT